MEYPEFKRAEEDKIDNYQLTRYTREDYDVSIQFLLYIGWFGSL